MNHTDDPTANPTTTAIVPAACTGRGTTPELEAVRDAYRAAHADEHLIIPVGGHSARSWCAIHNTYADLEGTEPR